MILCFIKHLHFSKIIINFALIFLVEKEVKEMRREGKRTREGIITKNIELNKE